VGERFFVEGKNGVTLMVRVKPGSREDAVLGVRAGELLVSVRARPERGKANLDVIRLLARVLCISRDDVVLKRGGALPHKAFSLPASVVPMLQRLERGA
jgi:uncharacterized protein YggU (UPF0235/DUF167 family)